MKRLEEVCQENLGMPVLYNCCQAISDEAWNEKEYANETSEAVIMLDRTVQATRNVSGIQCSLKICCFRTSAKWNC